MSPGPGAEAVGLRPPTGSGRAQSEVTGAMLLVVLVSIVVVVSGGLMLTNYADRTTGGPPVALDATTNGTDVTLHHEGGVPLALDDVTVVLRQDTARVESGLATWSLSRDDGDDRFEPAERATTSGLDPGEVEVVVVHGPTGSVLFDGTLVVEPAA